MSIGWSQRRRGSFRTVIFGLRELRSFASYVARSGQSEYYTKRWQNYLPSPVRGLMDRRVCRMVIGTRAMRSLLRSLEYLVPPAANIIDELKALQPDVVVASPVNMRFSEEVEYVKAAKALGIPMVLPVLSWDNLTTKGLIHVKPDLLLAWNDAHRREAMEIHGIPPHQIIITGSPFFSKWFEEHRLDEDRAAFFTRLGVDDPSRPLLTYLGSSKNIAKDESWLVQQIYDQINLHRDTDLRRAYLLVRPHPANADVYKCLKGDNLVVWPRDGCLPEHTQAQQDFYNSLKHSVCVMGINTSGMIDAVIHDVPCISILTEKYSLTQTQAEHFGHLLNADVLELASSASEAVEIAGRLLGGEDHRHPQRARFVQEFICPCGLDRSAGSVAAQAIEALVGKCRTRKREILLRQRQSNVSETCDHANVQ